MKTSDTRIQTICLVILTLIVCGVVLHLLEILFLPFLLAVFISLGLSSFVSLLVQRLRMFWGVLWGPLGIVLATPITGILALLASYSPLTQPIANLLSGQTVRHASTKKTDPHS